MTITTIVTMTMTTIRKTVTITTIVTMRIVTITTMTITINNHCGYRAATQSLTPKRPTSGSLWTEKSR